VDSAFQFGAIEVVAPGTTLISLVATLVGIALLGRLSYWRLFNKLSEVQPADIALLALLLAIVTSRVLSPQYLVWIFGVLAVCAFNPQPNFRRIFVLIFISSGLGQLIYPGWYVNFQLGGTLAVAAHTIRVIALVWATVLVWQNVSEYARNSKQVEVTY
jgi:hypothetical protein